MKTFFPWTLKNPSDRIEKAANLCERCGFNLNAWRKNVPDDLKKTVGALFKKLEKNPWIMLVCDNIKMIEDLYELIPITYISTHLRPANSFTTHDFVDPFERGDFEDDVVRFLNEFTRNEMILWIYPTTKYRKFFNYESRIFNFLTDQASSGSPCVFLIHHTESIQKDPEILERIFDEIGRAVGNNIAQLIKSHCNVATHQPGVDRQLFEV